MPSVLFLLVWIMISGLLCSVGRWYLRIFSECLFHHGLGSKAKSMQTKRCWQGFPKGLFHVVNAVVIILRHNVRLVYERMCIKTIVREWVIWLCKKGGKDCLFLLQAICTDVFEVSIQHFLDSFRVSCSAFFSLDFKVGAYARRNKSSSDLVAQKETKMARKRSFCFSSRAAPKVLHRNKDVHLGFQSLSWLFALQASWWSFLLQKLLQTISFLDDNGRFSLKQILHHQLFQSVFCAKKWETISILCKESSKKFWHRNAGFLLKTRIPFLHKFFVDFFFLHILWYLFSQMTVIFQEDWDSSCCADRFYVMDINWFWTWLLGASSSTSRWSWHHSSLSNLVIEWHIPRAFLEKGTSLNLLLTFVSKRSANFHVSELTLNVREKCRTRWQIPCVFADVITVGLKSSVIPWGLWDSNSHSWLSDSDPAFLITDILIENPDETWEESLLLASLMSPSNRDSFPTLACLSSSRLHPESTLFFELSYISHLSWHTLPSLISWLKIRFMCSSSFLLSS